MYRGSGHSDRPKKREGASTDVKLAALVLAVSAGIAISIQTLLNGSLGRSRGVPEALLISITVSYVALTILLAARALTGVPHGLPLGMRAWLALAVASMAAALTLFLAARGVAPWYFSAGLCGLVVLVAGAYATPILGVGTTAAALT